MRRGREGEKRKKKEKKRHQALPLKQIKGRAKKHIPGKS
jgi:hypothetical protein